MRPVVWLLFLIALCALGFFFVEYTLFNTIMAFAEAKAVQMAITTVNEAVREEISRQRLTYEDLVQVHKDNEGRVVLIQADTVKITQLAADVAVTTEEALARLRDEDFGIPLGQITGSQLLANYGPDIKVGIVPVGSVKVCMLDKFESAGINQTRHRFFLHLDAKVRIVVPMQRKETRVATDIPIVENVIVGTVPDTYVNVPGIMELFRSK
ncbi:MAG TPA: sporulation protein YunB [Desulfotomaculum sp.]|nr:sporulation protein YunB [Desulfotomaculum sp.]